MNVQSQAPVVARASHQFAASAERVFDAWLDPERAGKWLFTDATGELVRVEIDPRVGGRYIFTDRRDGEDIEHRGEYLEIDRPRRLVFTLSVPKYSQAIDRVGVEIVPLAAGCELSITHEMGAENAEWLDRTTEGWTMLLEALAGVLGER